jgi:hypothetical protein
MKERSKKFNKRIVKRDKQASHNYNEETDEEIADDLET